VLVAAEAQHPLKACKSPIYLLIDRSRNQEYLLPVNGNSIRSPEDMKVLKALDSLLLTKPFLCKVLKIQVAF